MDFMLLPQKPNPRGGPKEKYMAEPGTRSRFHDMHNDKSRDYEDQAWRCRRSPIPNPTHGTEDSHMCRPDPPGTMISGDRHFQHPSVVSFT